MSSAKKKEVKSAVKRTIVDFFENTSIHGLKYTIEGNTGVCERMFWGLAILMLTLVSVYLSYLHLKRFMDNPMRSTIITFHGPIDLVPFPAVTICHSNLMLKSKIDGFLESLNLEEEDEMFLKKNIHQISGYFQQIEYNTSDLNRMQSVFEKVGYVDEVEVFKTIGPSCNELLVQCRWSGEDVACFKIFEESLTIEGFCCSFNYYGSRFDFQPNYTIFTGWRSGLSVTIKSLLPEDSHVNSKSEGVKVTIHDSLEYPGFGKTYKPVSAGFSYFQISAEKLINTDEVHFLSKEQRQCVFSGEKPLKYHHTYHFSNCVAETYSRYIFRFCGCVPFYFTFSVRPKCTISQMECLQRYMREHRTLVQGDRNCPARCENVIYKVSTSNVAINNISLSLDEQHLNKLPDSSGIMMNVFFTGTHTLLCRDVLTTSIDLLSSIGGIYGLFIGCSIITIVELIYYSTLRFLVNLGWLKRPRRGHKKRTNNPESEFRTGWTRRRHDVHGNEWNNWNSITFSRIG